MIRIYKSVQTSKLTFNPFNGKQWNLQQRMVPLPGSQHYPSESLASTYISVPTEMHSIAFHYGLPPLGLPTTCVCGAHFTVEHALSCSRGAFPIIHSPIATCYRSHENQKKRAYEQRVREVEHATFTPLVMSATGGLARQATTFYKRLATS